MDYQHQNSYVSRSPNRIIKTGQQQQEIYTKRKADEETFYFWHQVDLNQHASLQNNFPKNKDRDKLLLESQIKDSKVKTIDDSIPVERSGPRVEEIHSIENFNDLHGKVPPFLIENIVAMKFEKPSPIQKHAVPFGLEGMDLICCSQTGSGKTLAFLLPIISSIHTAISLENSSRRFVVDPEKGVTPTCVILAPTRELASQIHLEAYKLCVGSTIRSVCLYGGADIKRQLSELSFGCDIIIATPGRLNDIVERGIISLSKVKILAFDEGDRMLDMGFEPQIRQIVEGSDMPSKQDRQTILFSATFADEIQKLAEEFLREYVWIGVGRTGSTVENITQRLELAKQGLEHKMEMLVPAIYSTKGSTLVFVQQRKAASFVREWLQHNTDIVAEEIHGLRSQAQRESALRSFREGNIRVLVATDVAARGLDIPDVTHVIQFDLPYSAEDFDVYIHRIGRTGRAGNSGLATSFYTPGKEVGVGNGKIAPLIMRLLKENQQEIPTWFSALDEAQETIGARTHTQSDSRGNGSGGNQQQQGNRRNFSNSQFASRDIRRDYRTQTVYNQPTYPSHTGHTDGYQYYAGGMMPQMMPYMVPQQGYGMSAYAMGQTQSMGYMTSYPQQVYYPQSAVPMTAPVNPATPATPIAQVYRSGVSEIGERNVAPFPAQVGTKNVNTNGVENMISKSPIKSPYASVTTSNTSTPANRLTDCETDLSNMSIEGKDESSNRDSGASDESLLGISRRVDGFSNSMQSPTKLQRFKTHPGNNPQQQYQQSQVQYQQQSLQQHQQQQYYAQQQSLQQQQPHIQQQQQKPGSASTRPPITSRSRSADSDVTSSPSYKQSYQQQPQPQQQPQYAQSVSSHGYQQQNPQSYNAAIYSYASMPQTQTVMYTYENGVAHPVVYQQPGVAPRAMYMAGYGPVAYPADGSYAQQSGTAQQQQQFAYYQQQSVAGVSHSVAPTAGTGTATGTATAGAQRSQQPGTAYYNKIPVSRQTGYGGRSSQSPSQPQFQTQPQQLQTLGSIANRTVSASPQR